MLVAATGRRTRGAPLADQVPAVLPPASRCTHKNVKRSGNQHGKHAVCQNPACGLKLRYDEDVGAWREFYSLSQQQLPHPSEGPILPAKAKARAKTVASHGYGMTPKARPAPTTTARPSRRPQEFDMRSVASSSAASRRSMEEEF